MTEKDSSLTEQKNQQPGSLFDGIRNKNLLNVAILYTTFFYGLPTDSRIKVRDRLWTKRIIDRNCNIACELQPTEIIEVIKCTKKEAYEYIVLMRLLTLGT